MTMPRKTSLSPSPLSVGWVFVGSTTFGEDGLDEEIVEECPACRRRVYRYNNQEQDLFCPRCGRPNGDVFHRRNV